MGLLCLVPLILLSQPLLIQSVFQQVDVHCDHASNETTACLLDGSCSWKANLASCQTLQIHCIEQDGWGKERFCTSSEECGFSNFPDTLIGVIDCEITKAKNKHEIKCQLNVECGFAKYICATPKECHWNPNKQFKEINDARCVLQHDVSHCIKVNPKLNLMEDLNCTITSSKTPPNTGTETGGQCDNKPSEGQNHGCVTSIIFNVILGIVVIAILTIWGIMRCKGRDSGGL
ncbi:uncharacterized protein LOC118803025 [Colossoma macropomum]|uniref:uncharacterized protein LOC118803025 n=1 Tax=Colossoma macropomum TaxID=42526 RepID=UPI001863AFFA|nr:uncharacterized protein LOC118803025 [Colossoma macropomum]